MRRRSASVESENLFVFGQTGPSHSAMRGEADGGDGEVDVLSSAKQRRNGTLEHVSELLDTNAEIGHSVPTEYSQGQPTNLAGSDYLTAQAQCKNESARRSSIHSRSNIII